VRNNLTRSVLLVLAVTAIVGCGGNKPAPAPAADTTAACCDSAAMSNCCPDSTAPGGGCASPAAPTDTGSGATETCPTGG
jgi:hypothetical protein